MRNLGIGDRVEDILDDFHGVLLGTSGAVYDWSPTDGDTEIPLWAVEDPKTREVRHLRQDRLILREQPAIREEVTRAQVYGLRTASGY